MAHQRMRNHVSVSYLKEKRSEPVLNYSSHIPVTESAYARTIDIRVCREVQDLLKGKTLHRHIHRLYLHIPFTFA